MIVTDLVTGQVGNLPDTELPKYPGRYLPMNGMSSPVAASQTPQANQMPTAPVTPTTQTPPTSPVVPTSPSVAAQPQTVTTASTPVSDHPFAIQDSSAFMKKAYDSGYRSAAQIKQVQDYVAGQQQKDQNYQAILSGKLQLTDLPSDQRGEIAAALPPDYQAVSQKQRDAKQVKDELKNSANAVLSVMDQGKKGLLTGQAYQDALLAATSMFSSASGFGQGGKALTAPELGQLAGQKPNVEVPVQSALDKLLGRPVTASGVIKDTPETLYRKAYLVANGFGSDPSTYEKILAGLPKEQSKPTGVGGLINNAIGDVVNMGKGLVQSYGNQRTAVDPLQAILNPQAVKQAQSNTANEAVNMIPNQLNQYNNDLGRPTEGGDVLGRAGANLYQHPVSTILDALPFLAAGKSMLGRTGRMAGGVSDVAAADAKAGFLSNQLKNISDRANSAVSIPKTSSLLTSDELMGKAQQILPYNKALTVAGMARELEKGIPVWGDEIKSIVSPMSDKVGPISGAKTVDAIMNELKNTSELSTNPKLTAPIRSFLENQLENKTAQVPNSPVGKWYTDLNTMDKARMNINKNLTKWYGGGSPTDTSANQLNALKANAGEYLREILAQQDKTGKINELLGKQHTALQVAPQLSEQYAKSSARGGSLTAQVLHTLSNIIEPAKVEAGRFLAKKVNPRPLGRTLNPTGNPLLDKILNPEAPAPQQVFNASVPKVNEATTSVGKANPLNKILFNKNSPQGKVVRKVK